MRWRNCLVFVGKCWIAISALPSSAQAVEYLVNRSFELPVAPANGNNFYATIPNWTLAPTPASATPANIVVPTAAYANNPQVTPTGGGRQYFDMNSVGGIVSQSVTFPTSGRISMGSWFSVRDFSQNLSNGAVVLRNASNVVVATGTVSFTTADPIGTWRRASVSGISVPAGTYTMQIVLDNYHNVDLASLDFVADAPALAIDKTSNKTAPVVVGETITYTFLVTNIGNVRINNVSISDVHNGLGVAPVPGSEVLFTDSAPLGDSTNSVANNNVWDALQPGDAIKFFSTYVVTQADIDYRQ